MALDDLRGKVWVADFIFTNCAGPCPRLTSHMSRLQEALAGVAGGGEVRLVSFSVDPEKDTPEVLAEYGRRFRADFTRWSFLTGGKQAIYDLIFEGFKLAIDDGALSKDGTPGPGIITHSVRFVLVDREGRIRGYYPGEDADIVERIAPDIERLLAEPPDQPA